jgi:hypothetical protein
MNTEKTQARISGTLNPIVGDDYRRLSIGEAIRDGDVFVYGGRKHPATDTGNGVMSQNHWPHFRLIANDKAQILSEAK